MNKLISAIINKIGNDYNEYGTHEFQIPIEFEGGKIISVTNNYEFKNRQKMVTYNPEEEIISIKVIKDNNFIKLFGGSMYEHAINTIYNNI